MAVNKILKEFGIRIAFMGVFIFPIVSAAFENTSQDDLLNIPLELLPAFRGMNADIKVMKICSNWFRVNSSFLRGCETVEIPSMHSVDENNLPGFYVDAVEQNRLLHSLDKIGYQSHYHHEQSFGIHFNACNLVRNYFEFKVFSNINEAVFDEALLRHTKTSIKKWLLMMKAELVKGAADLTGDDVAENTPYMLHSMCGVQPDGSLCFIHPFFKWMVTEAESRNWCNY